MDLITVKPYEYLEDKDFIQPCTILLENKEFNNKMFEEGCTTFQIRNCHFVELKIENFEEINFKEISLFFSECYIEQIEVTEILSQNILIDFHSCVIHGAIRNSNIQAVNLNNSLLLNSLFLINVNRVFISFTENNIEPLRWKRFFKKNDLNYHAIKNCKQEYYVHNCIKIGFEIDEEKKRDAIIYRRRKEQIDKFKIGYSIWNEKKHFHLQLNVIYGTKIEDVETKITNGFFEAFTLSGTPKGKLEIENTQICRWYLHDFKPKGEVNFYDISPTKLYNIPPIIEFHQCNLDNTSFDNINFLDFDKISFYRTKFSKTLFTSCNFPNSYKRFEGFTSLKNIHYPDLKRDNYRKDQYEIFIQMKMALANTGNFYEAQNVQAVANEALSKINGLSLSDRFILYINGISNNHGISIKRPFRWFLGISISLYIFYLMSLGRIFINTPIDYTLFGYYFSFIDITHNLDFLVDKTQLNFFSLTIDFLNKLVVGFLIYQFVAAFRKYGKSS